MIFGIRLFEVVEFAFVQVSISVLAEIRYK